MTRAFPRRRQRGIGMIEVLIAVLVVSIGFLGMAALQARALSTNNSAMARSMATIASYSILDAMRADLTNAKAGNYNTSSAIAANACPAGTGSLEAYQVNAWCTELGDKLGAVASTTGNIDCSTDGDCTITIQFADNRSGTNAASSATQQVVTRAML